MYTHYDLHTKNVLLFRPDPSKTIQYNYHTKDGIITFKCPYVPKIIDYGRCFFNNGTETSKHIYDKLCSIKECGKCGAKYGFTYHSPTEFLAISIQKKNESHDLLLLYKMLQGLPYSKTSMAQYRKSISCRMLEKMGPKILYNVDIPESKQGLGTKENTTLHPKGDIIANVTDVYQELKKIITNPKVIQQNNMIQPDTMIAGTFNIYEDGRPMEYFTI